MFSNCNISTQHLATLLGATCSVRLGTLLRYVATRWMMLDQIWKRSNFSCRIFDVAWCCSRLATFTQHCCTRACALGPLVARQGPGAHKHWHVALKSWKCCVRLASPFNTCRKIRLCNNVATMLQDVCCFEMLWAFGQAFTFCLLRLITASLRSRRISSLIFAEKASV